MTGRIKDTDDAAKYFAEETRNNMIKDANKEKNETSKPSDKYCLPPLDEMVKPFGTQNPDGEYNVYGSKLEDVREINRLRDENLELKMIIGDMQLKIFRLSSKLQEKD